MKGKRIVNLTILSIAALDEKVVIVPNDPYWAEPHPASNLLCLPGNRIIKLFRQGMYEYDK